MTMIIVRFISAHILREISMKFKDVLLLQFFF